MRQRRRITVPVQCTSAYVALKSLTSGEEGGRNLTTPSHTLNHEVNNVISEYIFHPTGYDRNDCLKRFVVDKDVSVTYIFANYTHYL